MPRKKGESRLQYGLFATSLEDMIAGENEVRVIDAFVDALDLATLGFTRTDVKDMGSGSYGADRLLKLYIYGYLNKIRSSRRLAKECERNIELWWLLEQLQPAYHTIADFRKENPSALKAAFRQFSKLLREWELLGGELVAIDGTKLRAQNSKKNNYNQAKIDRHLDYIDGKIEAYFTALQALDQAEANYEHNRAELKAKIEEKMKRDDYYTSLQDQLKASGDTQISTVDTDARALPQHRNIVEVGFNVQTAVDGEHHLIASVAVINERDEHSLHDRASEANEVLQSKSLKVLADKGFHTGSELEKCESDAQLETYVARQVSKSGVAGFRKSDFEYDSLSDTYQCPEGEYLKTNGKWYKKNSSRGRRSYEIQRYTLPYRVCSVCPHAGSCNKGGMKNRHGRNIERTQYDKVIEVNAARLEADPELYRRRQAIVEHPFGTIKRQWGYDHFLLRGLKKVGAEAALICLAYNLRRSMSICGVPELIKRLKALKSTIMAYFEHERHHQASWCGNVYFSDLCFSGISGVNIE